MSDKIKKCEVCGETKGRIINSDKFKRILCHRHYKQMEKHGAIQPDKPNEEKKCDECGKTEGEIINSNKYKRTLCYRHYRQMYMHGKILPDNKKICEECGETEGRIYGSNRFGLTLCKNHYSQMARHGRILERTMYDKNDILESGEISYIILRNRKQEEVARAIIDTEDLENIRQYKWSPQSKIYPTTRIDGRDVTMHRMIMNYHGKLEIDHINRNRLDNRKVNLRIVDRQENNANRGKFSNNKSGVIGVCYEESKQKWNAHMTVSGKRHFKRFKTMKEAIKERLLLEKEFYPEHPPQRHLFEQYGISLT